MSFYFAHTNPSNCSAIDTRVDELLLFRVKTRRRPAEVDRQGAPVVLKQGNRFLQVSTNDKVSWIWILDRCAGKVGGSRGGTDGLRMKCRILMRLNRKKCIMKYRQEFNIFGIACKIIKGFSFLSPPPLTLPSSPRILLMPQQFQANMAP